MNKIVIVFWVIGGFLIGGCMASKEERLKQIKSQYPQWDQVTIETVAEKKVVPGMNEQMVFAAMGKPWSIEQKGDVTVWAYGYLDADGWGAPIQKLTYFIYFQDMKVVGTRGDKSKLGFSYR